MWASSFNTCWPKVTTAWRDDQLVALGWFNKARNTQFFSDKFFADYSNILIDPEHEMAGQLLIERTIDGQKCHTTLFEPLRDIEDGTRIILAVALKYLHSQYVLCSNPYIDLDMSYLSFLSSLPKNLRQDLRTSRNNLSKNGSWHFYEAQTVDDKKRVLSALISFHVNRQHDKVGKSIFSVEDNVQFFKQIISNNLKEFKIHLSAIEQNNRIISASLSISCRKKFYYWIPSFDQSIKRISLGKLHIMHLIEYCYNNNFSVFDFMGGDESYKYQWCKSKYNLMKVVIFKSNFLFLYEKIFMNIRDYLRMKKNNSNILGKLWLNISKLRQD